MAVANQLGESEYDPASDIAFYQIDATSGGKDVDV
jgi:hypothetical protein